MASEHLKAVCPKPLGRYSQAIKSDIVSSLLVLVTCGTPTQARLSVRLSLVITARYNWRTGRFGVGQKELARMWGVTERTAKRELAHMRGLGWISIAVASGRVAQHKINLDTVLLQSAPHWDAIGPDFAARMTGAPEQEREPADTNVVPLRVSNETPIYDNNTGWAMVAERLREQDPAIFNAWLSQLTALEGDDTSITLGAPSKFVAQYVNTHFLQRIKASLVAIEGGQRQIKILCLED